MNTLYVNENSTVYLNMVVLNEDATRVLCLFKLKGPEKLIGRWNVPGGKREAGETSVAGAIRELQEEAGIAVREEDATIIRALVFPNGDMLDTYAVRVSDEVLDSYEQLEEEPLKVFNVRELRAKASLGEIPVAHDMDEMLHKAILATEYFVDHSTRPSLM
jgi:8-oxo-dGTP pyrophosphatase MutT (NUDIX family)